MVSAIAMSAAGRAALMIREGCRLVAYRDSVGVWTIGVGHTGRTCAPSVRAGMTFTHAQADAALMADLAPVEAAVAAAVKVPLGVNERDALISLGFNIGITGLTRSTVVRRLNAGDRTGAADAMLLWCKPPELMGRRKEERAQFLRSDAVPAIALQPAKPVLNLIVSAINTAAAPPAPAFALPTLTWWEWIRAPLGESPAAMKKAA